MRIRMIGVIAVSALVTSACGSVGGKSPTELRPPTPVSLSVYVNNTRVSVSPTSVGAGPVVFVVANQASQAEALRISKAGQNNVIASTAPINPQGTTSVSVNFSPGRYTIATASRGSTDASLSQPPLIRSASITIGRERANSSNTVLQP